MRTPGKIPPPPPSRSAKRTQNKPHNFDKSRPKTHIHGGKCVLIRLHRKNRFEVNENYAILSFEPAKANAVIARNNRYKAQNRPQGELET